MNTSDNERELPEETWREVASRRNSEGPAPPGSDSEGTDSSSSDSELQAVVYGAGATAATAATVVYHAIALWVPALWGTIAYLILRRTRGQPLRLRPTLEERRRLKAARRQKHEHSRAEAGS